MGWVTRFFVVFVLSFHFLSIASAEISLQDLAAKSNNSFDPGPINPQFGNYPMSDDPRDSVENKSMTPTQQVMTTLQDSKLPDITCPLVDSTTDQDLLGAVENLHRISGAVNSCQTANGDVINSKDIQVRMNELTLAIKSIYTLFTNVAPALQNSHSAIAYPGSINKAELGLLGLPNPAAGTVPPVAVPQPPGLPLLPGVLPPPSVGGIGTPGVTGNLALLSNLQTIFTQLTTLSNTLSQAASTPGCEKEKASFTDIISTIAQVTTVVAPYALAAVTANPAWPIAAKTLMGVISVASGVNFIKSLGPKLADNTPENRKIILTNLCDYARISQRMRLIAFAQENGAVNIRSTLKSEADRDNQYLNLKANQIPHLINVLSHRDAVQAELLRARSEFSSSIFALQNLFDQLSTSSDEFACSVGSNYLKNADKQGELIWNIQDAYGLQKKYQTEQTEIQEARRIDEEQLRKSPRSTDPTICAKQTRQYLDALYQYARTGLATSNLLQTAFRSWLDSNPAVKSYLKTEDALRSDQQTHEEILSLAARASKDAAALNYQEIDAQMAEIGKKLLSTTPNPAWESWLPSMSSTPAPVELWLNFSQTQVQQIRKAFLREFKGLVRTADSFTSTGGTHAFKMYEGFDGSDVMWASTPYTVWKRTGKVVSGKVLDDLWKQAQIDDTQAEQLNTLTINNLTKAVLIPQDPNLNFQAQYSQLDMACKNLESADEQIHFLMYSLRAQGLFCETLFYFNLINTKVSQRVRETCEGKTGNAQQITQLPYVIQQVQQFKAEGLWDKWQLIQNKRKELNCKNPEAPTAPKPAA